METFPIPAEEHMIGAVNEQLANQQQIVDAIVGDMAAKLSELKGPTEDTVGRIKRALKKTAKQLVNRDDAITTDLIQTMGTEAGQKLINQQSIVDQIIAYRMQAPTVLSGLTPPADGMSRPPPVGAGACIPTGFGVYRQPDGSCLIFPFGCGDALPPGQRVASFPTTAAALTWIAANCGNRVPPPPPAGGDAGQTGCRFAVYLYLGNCGVYPAPDPGCIIATPIPPGTAPLSPYFPDSGSAVTWLKAHPEVCPSGGGGGGGGGSGGGNGQICPPAPQLYFVICPPGGGKAVCGRIDQVQNGTMIISGPYNTQEECTAALPAACNDPCGTIGPPPPYKPPVTTCAVCGWDSLPVPGSPQWCEQEADIRAACLAAGNWLIDQVKATLYKQEGTGFFDDITIRDILSGIGVSNQVLKSIWSWIFDNWTALRQKIQQLIDCWEQFVSSFPCANPKQVFALAVLRALVRMMSHFHLGLELPFVAHTELGVELLPLDRILTYLLEAACPSVIPSPNESIETWIQGGINEDTFTCWLSAYGVSREVWDPVLRRRGEHLQAREVIQWGRRNGLDKAQIDSELRDIGWVRDDDRERVQYLYNALPTIGDFLHFLQRNVFDKQYVTQYELLKGFEEKFWPNYGDALTALGMEKKWAEEHYASHWINPAPTQLREFVYRLRPNKEGVIHPFTTDDFRNLLVEQDVAPRAVEWFVDTLYRVPAFSYTTRQYQLGIITDAQLKSRIMDQGYDDDTATEMAKAMHADKERMRAAQSVSITPRSAGQLVLAGLLPRQDAALALTDQGFSEEEIDGTFRTAELEYKRGVGMRAITTARMRLWRQIDQSYRAGTIDRSSAMEALTNAGWPDSAASVLLQTADASVAQSLAHEVVGAMKKAYVGGHINDGEALAHLTAAGISPDRAGQHIAAWNLERIGHTKFATTADILRWVREGYLSPVKAGAMLANLGWKNPDLLLLLAENYARYEASVIKRQQAAQKDARKAAAELEKLQRAHQVEIKRTQALIMKYEPLSEVKRLFINGRRTLDWVKRRLTAGGYPADSVADYTQTWQDERSAAWERWQKTHEGFPPPGRPGGGGPESP